MPSGADTDDKHDRDDGAWRPLGSERDAAHRLHLPRLLATPPWWLPRGQEPRARLSRDREEEVVSTAGRPRTARESWMHSDGPPALYFMIYVCTHRGQADGLHRRAYVHDPSTPHGADGCLLISYIR